MSALPHGPLFMDATWLLLVSIKTTRDLELLPTRCSDSTRNEQVKASVCRINLAFLPT